MEIRYFLVCLIVVALVGSGFALAQPMNTQIGCEIGPVVVKSNYMTTVHKVHKNLFKTKTDKAWKKHKKVRNNTTNVYGSAYKIRNATQEEIDRWKEIYQEDVELDIVPELPWWAYNDDGSIKDDWFVWMPPYDI